MIISGSQKYKLLSLERIYKMKEKLRKIAEEAAAAISESGADLEALRIKYLGKKGELTAVLRGMGALSPEERPVIGQLANEVRSAIEASLRIR